jgi:adenylyl- and sulfurtransferase ThiI
MAAELNKEDLKRDLAAAAHEVCPSIKVNLKNPDIVILVEVVKVSPLLNKLKQPS